ncbi:unnamed protein product [Caenorhabditis brenneri]
MLFSSLNQKKSFFETNYFIITLVVGWLLFSPILFFLCAVFSSSSEISTSDLAQELTTVADFSATTATTSEPADQNCTKKRIVGYYTGWETMEVTAEQLRKLTHVIFLHAVVTTKSTLEFESTHSMERFLDMQKEAKKAKEVNEDLKVMVSIGGWRNSKLISGLLKDPMKLQELIKTILSFVKKYQLDGVEIFWIDPVLDKKLKDETKEKFSNFIRDLKSNLFHAHSESTSSSGFILSMAVPSFVESIREVYNFKELVKSVEFINVQSYDYFDPGAGKLPLIGPTSPMFAGNGGNVEDTMKYLICTTKHPEKLNMGVAFHGTYWKNVSLPYLRREFVFTTVKFLNRSSIIHLQTQPHEVSYGDLKIELRTWKDAKFHFHNESKSSYYWMPKTKTFLTIETEKSLREKMVYANRKKLGGTVMMSIDQDDEHHSLLDVVVENNGCISTANDELKYNCNLWKIL